ncbi:MAG: helix-turn-helix domain-containing protein, partial [Chitinophagaceae bacterium]
STQIQLKNPKRIRATKPEQEKVNDSKRYSLQLFREGRRPETIAAMREITQGTVESHLAFFIRTGELDIHELFPKEKVNVIFKEIQQMEGPALAPVKQKLGDNYSYGEIRAVISYWEWMKEAGIEI